MPFTTPPERRKEDLRGRGNAAYRGGRAESPTTGETAMTQAAQIPEADGPAYDRVYQKVIREQFDALALDGPFARGLARRFRQGPMAVCSKAIGTWINRQLKRLGWTQQQLADRLDVDRSAVAYWIRGGNIHLVNLAQVLLEFHSHWSELPVPPRQ